MPDTIYLIAIIVVFFVGLIAQSRVRSVFNKYNNVRASSNLPANAVAKALLGSFGAHTALGSVGGTLTDHYDPRNDTVGLSQTVYNSASISALAVAAHEIGHVQQYYDGYAPIRIRNTILPIANFASQIAPWLVIGGIILSALQLVFVGAILYGVVFLFQLATLPVEFNASKRGVDMLISGGYISSDQVSGAEKVLRAAAMTYVIATLASLLTFLRFIAIANRRRN